MTIDVTSNRNFLIPQNFRFALKRSPNVNFFVQSINLPNISLKNTEIPTPFVNVPDSGIIDYTQFAVEFIVDEEMKNWMEIHDWMRGRGEPTSPETEYAPLKRRGRWEPDGLVSDISVIVENSAHTPTMEFTFHDSFPVSLTGFSLDSRTSDQQYATSRVVFNYLYFDIEAIK